MLNRHKNMLTFTNLIQIAMRITFFKTGKPREFKYVPIFYDQEKEELENRKRQIEREMGVGKDEVYHHSISRGSISHKFTKRKQANRSSVVRLLIIVAILVLIVLYFMR
jgi:hypothetical protein